MIVLAAVQDEFTDDLVMICLTVVAVAAVLGFTLAYIFDPRFKHPRRPSPKPAPVVEEPVWTSETKTTTYHPDPSEGSPRRLHPVNDDDLPPDVSTG